ncbi:MAG: DegT/DnrJ/EryC1/StrS family aminotransferase [Gemmatimonadota bacterium]|nr:MAG: DegT/DnrJ/EryC1/StrS family aminotransferase [Gemmatimonadota bacterium]
MGARVDVESAGPIPLLDLARQHLHLGEELTAAVRRVAESQSFVLGAAVEEFEAAIAHYLGVGHAIGVASGTDALYLCMRLLDLRDGDEVITSPFTFFATAGAIANAGGRVVFADIDPLTFNLDPRCVADVISERTRAILPVHLFGQMVELQPLLDLADQRGLWIIEDAAQSMGAKALVGGSWRAGGTVGTLGCFSFYPTKNLGGWGDGGLITTNDPDLAERLRRLRVHGEDPGLGRYVHGEVGVNSRLDAIQAAVLSVKLRHLPGWTELRRARAAEYDRRLDVLAEVTTPVAQPDRFHVYNLYTIRAQRRTALRDHLTKRNIGSGVYYPLPLHRQPCFRGLGYEAGQFPQAERAAEEVLSLPLFPELTAAEQGRVVETIQGFYGG